MTVWLNADQVAERLSVSRRTALALMYQMPYSVISGTAKKRIRVSENSLEAWMVKRSNKTHGTEAPRTGSRKKLQRR